MKKSKQLLAYLLLIILSIGVWLTFSASGVLDGIEEETLRWRYLWRGEIESTAPITYVDLDAATISYMGDRPWDRREFADLMEALIDHGGARVVGLDIVLSKFGAGTLIDQARVLEGEAALGDVVKRYPDQIVLAAAYTNVPATSTGEASKLPLIREGYGPKTAPFPEAPSYPIIQFGMGKLGLVNVDETLSGGAVPYFIPAFVDLDSPRYSFHLIYGIMRHKAHFMNEPFAKVIGDEVVLTDKDGFSTDKLPVKYPLTLFTLALESFLMAEGLNAADVEIGADSLKVYRAGEVFRRIPLVEAQSVEVNWFEGWDHRTDHGRQSMQEVLRQAKALNKAIEVNDTDRISELRTWFERFQDKVVFVGPVDPMLKDIAPTPFNREPVPKVGVHANLYRTIHEEAFLSRVGPTGSSLIAIALAAAVSLLALGQGLPRVISLLILFGYTGLTFWVFAQSNCVLPVVVPIAATITAASSVVFLKLGAEEWQRRRIKNLFGAYVSPKLVDQMVDSDQEPQLGGTEAAITALFFDVEGFSALAEELSAGQLVSLMNEYLGAMTEVFQAKAGTLDKYIGDAIVTMFGMPVPVEDHASRACLAAIEMQERHAALREKWATSGEWPDNVVGMRTRIGLNTGVAVIGNMGSDMRFNYTMMGDSVNLAARCESGAKSYGVYTMVTGNTLKRALEEGAQLSYRKLDRVVVKGRSQPVDLFELWEPSVPSDQSLRCKEAYEAALALYFSEDWAGALAGFEASESLEPAQAFAPTTPSAVLAQRCRDFLEKGTPVGWNGAYSMETK